MASLAQAGRDKITLISSPQIAAFGLWAEQLLAESTGKEGTGLIPVAHEPIVSPTAYGTDRLFVYLRLKGDQNRQLDRQIAGLARQGHPILTLTLQDRYDLAGEFFRWEIATALAGHLLGIHPFDQPNVQESKDNTARVLATIQATGRLPKQATSTAAQAASQLKRQCRPGAYVAILAYTTPSSKMEQGIRMLRKALVSHHHVTTTAGYGPRYLHSTGQLHKGGPKIGLFLQLVDQMTPDLSIPGKPFTFRTLAQAQAAGDIQALHAHEQQAIVLPLGKNPIATIQTLTKLLTPRTRGSASHYAAHQERAYPQEVGCPPSPTSAFTATAKQWLKRQLHSYWKWAKRPFVRKVDSSSLSQAARRRKSSTERWPLPPSPIASIGPGPSFFSAMNAAFPPNDPRSNYALADKTLFTPLNITPSQVYRMAGESSDPQAAASEYEQQLRLATKTVPSVQPSLDLILLGLGEDGHTASLFPGSPILQDHRRAIAATQSPKDPP